MAIKAGAILTDVNGFVVDRIQSGGPGNLNIPEEKIYELGNWNTVATIRDIPDLSFDLESFDVFSEFEALLLGKTGAAAPGVAASGNQLSGVVGSNEVDFQDHIPIDVISPFKSRRNAYNIVKGVAVPYLTLENATYRFGIGQNAAQSFTLRGDSIYYTPGQPFYTEVTYSGSAGAVSGAFGGRTALLYEEDGDQIYALCVVAVTDQGDYKRLFIGDDFTNTSTSLTITAGGAAKIASLQYTTLANTKIRVVYSANPEPNSYNQTGNNPSGNPVHQNVSVKPAAVRPKDIDVYIGTTGATPVFTRFTSVQSAEVTWSVTLDPDQEFGNKHYVSQDYDIPDVTGSIGVRPYNPADMWDKLATITGVSSSNVVGPDSAVPVPMEIRINHPDTGDRVKTIYVPDARFQIPGFSGQVQQKLETTLPFTSDGGLMYVYNGERV